MLVLPVRKATFTRATEQLSDVFSLHRFPCTERPLEQCSVCNTVAVGMRLFTVLYCSLILSVLVFTFIIHLLFISVFCFLCFSPNRCVAVAVGGG